MPKVSGLIVPKLCHRCHDGNIRCLEPVAPFANHHDYGSGEDKEAQNKEEPLGIVTEVTAIIFLVAFLNLPAFLDKHGIDLTDILLHLAIHLCSRSNRSCIFCQLASAKFTETFNLSGASFITSSICVLMLSTLPRMSVTVECSVLSAR